jgi:hypothetical protein
MSYELPDATLAAARRARDELRIDRPDERGMAAFARRAVFCEALLAAVRAHANEMRTVAR